MKKFAFERLRPVLNTLLGPKEIKIVLKACHRHVLEFFIQYLQFAHGTENGDIVDRKPAHRCPVLHEIQFSSIADVDRYHYVRNQRTAGRVLRHVWLTMTEISRMPETSVLTVSIDSTMRKTQSSYIALLSMGLIYSSYSVGVVYTILLSFELTSVNIFRRAVLWLI